VEPKVVQFFISVLRFINALFDLVSHAFQTPPLKLRPPPIDTSLSMSQVAIVSRGIKTVDGPASSRLNITLRGHRILIN
jgi:hypothetical protein